MPNNPAPQNVVHRKVTIGTTNSETLIPEGHKVYGPYAQDITVATLPVGQKKVIPLTDNTGEGAHFLKLTFPNPTETTSIASSTLYITFCKKDATYTDGYKDYVTALPESYINDLKHWIDNGRSPLQSSQIRYRKLVFTAYGRHTLQPQNALTFEVRFNYTGVVINSGSPSTGGSTPPPTIGPNIGPIQQTIPVSN